ncbi:hypothetical protein [Streptoalloteichus hindustanus]|uniref:Uncharacterized protein n=1 Tax=Streptoalloteichus hindustanus TaxID=2017 RepID=A0A1M5IC85_STRHI|nr:hypothetical protein [Streptoalloteichus hindustanus]SHG25383.1 hypothetical protein SAMN05444320_107200 [Streptoalloteichus hindustanus]
MVWSILSGLVAVGAVVLVLLGHPLVASVMALVGMILAVVAGERRKAQLRAEFRDRYRSVEEILRTHDLSEIHQLRDESGEVVAVRAVRRQFRGISLQDATTLVRS